MKYVDPDGRDIVLLLDPDRGRASWPILNLIPFGHSAALIGNDNDGWLYYSNDGPASTDVQWFDTKEKFFSSYKDNRGEPFNFEESGSVKTTPEQDAAMQSRAFELAGINQSEGFSAKITEERFIITEQKKNSPYSFLFNNCSQHVGKIAAAGGLFSVGTLIPKLQTILTEDEYLKYIQIEIQKSSLMR